MTTNVTALRLQLRAAGFSPLPAQGKKPPMQGWSEKFDTTDAEIRLWPKTWHLAHNTGILAKFAPGLDIDIKVPEAAQAIEALAREYFEENGNVLVRFGERPKRLIPLRTDEPFDKLVRNLAAPDGSLQKIEILGDGQQYIVDGIHPETERPYGWHGGELANSKREDLPYVRRADMEKFLDAAVKLLIEEFGFTDQSSAQTNDDARRERPDTRWGEINERALANLDRWVPKLFPTAERSQKGYRVKSADLGRGREEDLSITPHGIKYFGDHDMGDPRHGRRSAIDVVMEWNHLEFIPAAEWLEDRLARADLPPAEKPEPPKGRRFRLKPFSEITLSNAPTYLVKGILPRTGLAVVWGPPKCGKSFWTFDLVMHVATDRPYRGRRVQQGAVVYLALEGGSGFAGRVEAWRRRCLAEDHGRVPFYLLDVPVDLVADRDALIEAIRQQLDGTRPAVIVIDTLNRALLGDENKSDDMAKFIRAADAVRTAFGCLVVVVHHCGVVGTRPRGHTSLAGADDAQIAVERDKDGNIVAKIEHMKDGEAGTVIASKLERVELGTDTDGDSLSSCVIVPAEGVAAGVKLTKVQKFAFELLQKLMKSESDTVEAPKDAPLPASTRICLSDTWRKAFYRTYPAEKMDTKKKALLRATLDLEELKLIELWNEYVWVRDQSK
jgi:hypothetical protein